MGLDASVYCDCAQTGRLVKPHPFLELSAVAADGSPDINSQDEKKKQIFYDWYDSQPCAHENFQLVSCHLGNIGLIGTLRSAVDEIAEKHRTVFPILRGKVIYSGSHAGDYLGLEQVEALSAEIARLRSLSWNCLRTRATLKERLGQTFDNQRALYLTDFLAQMDELIAVSRRVSKPIVF